MHTEDEAYIGDGRLWEGPGLLSFGVRHPPCFPWNVLITMAGEENDWPAEIAKRLMADGAVSETSFVGLHDKRSCCLSIKLRLQRIFLLGCPTTRYEPGCLKTRHSGGNAAIGDDIPQNGSGKLKTREAYFGGLGIKLMTADRRKPNYI
jgi:hypothetical protein